MIKPHNSTQGSGLRMVSIVVAVIAGLYFARQILIPLAFAITLTVILSPAVTILRKMRAGRAPAVLLVIGISMAVAGGVGFVIFNEIVQVLTDLPNYRQNIDNKIRTSRLPFKGALGRAQQSVTELGKELAAPPPSAPASNGRPNRQSSPAPPARPMPVQIVEDPSNELQYVRDLTLPFLAPLATLLVILVFTIFLLIEEADVRNRLFRLAGLDRLNVVTQALEDAGRRVSRYLLLQFLVNAVFGIICGIGLGLIGVPYAALWGVVAALLRIVPYVGSVVAGLVPLLLSLAVFDGWLQPVLVFLLFSTLELITGNFLEPWLYGAQTGISGLALLLTTVFWTALWGPAGLILATPLTVCVAVLGRHIPHLSFLHVLLGDQPVLVAEAHMYQRLLALDDREAKAIAERFLEQNSLLQLYDEVILPVLTMAEQDRHKGALEPEREEFLFLSVREMLPEFQEVTAAVVPEPLLQSRFERVICVAANDEADEIAAAMLAQLLENAGFATIAFPLDSALLDMISLADPGERDVLFISSVPPFAFTHARLLHRKLSARFPKTSIAVGVWGFSGEARGALKRFQPSPAKVTTSFAEAIQFLARDSEVPAAEAVTAANEPAPEAFA